MRHADEYPLNEGSISGSDGLSLPIAAYEDLFQESHAAHSTALYSRYRNRPYLVGPLARLNLNLDRLPPPVRRNLERSGVPFPSRNMFHSIVARAVEMHFALLEALRVMDDYRLPDAPRVEVAPRAGVGYGCTEAPRGMLWQRWETNDQGEILELPHRSAHLARTRREWRTTCATGSRLWGWMPPRTRCASAARRCCATTTRASRAPPTSCASRCIVAEPDAGCRLRIVGIGSPFGADRLGWDVIDMASAGPLPDGVEAVRCAQPFERTARADAWRRVGVPGGCAGRRAARHGGALHPRRTAGSGCVGVQPRAFGGPGAGSGRGPGRVAALAADIRARHRRRACGRCRPGSRGGAAALRRRAARGDRGANSMMRRSDGGRVGPRETGR
ncbi:MAG: hypothetical protein MZW92_16240 [Comamonadaceae bacterium]|nr:hypothetical protein [Comamonadaceae bacterium]